MADSQEHYHVFFCVEPGRVVRRFETRANEAFASRAAANKWARRLPPERRLVRKCTGGPHCPGPFVPDYELRRPVPKVRKRSRRRPPRLVNIRRRLDAAPPEILAQIEALLA
ncbi:MAG: hypothetical protein OXI18_11525 [bacterium]|nr:hypothetical protein [bacterium]